MTNTYTHTATYTYTRSELIADLVSGTFDHVLGKLGSKETVPTASFEEVLKRGWLKSLSLVASTRRPNGSHDWRVALVLEIDAKTHVARLKVDAERTIELEQERADGIADRLSYYGQMFVKLAQRHAQPGWEYSLWWEASEQGDRNHAEFNRITGTRPTTFHHGRSQRVGQYSPEEIDEATFGLEVFDDAE